MHKSGEKFREATPEHGLESERTPQVSYRFHFEHHDPSKPAEGMIKHMRSADLVAIEQVGWSKEDQKLLDKIASGALSVDEIKRKGGSMTPRWESLLRAIGEQKKACFYVDVPEGPLQKTLESRRKERDVFLKRETETFLFDGNYNESLALEKQAKRHFFDTIKIREAEIIKKFPHRVADAVKKHPDLAQKGQLSVLVGMGADHTPVYHAMRGKLDARMSSDDIFKSYSDEILQRMSCKKEISDELYGKSLLENVFFKVLQTQPNPLLSALSIYDRKLYVRSIVAQFTEVDIRAFCSDIQRQSSRNFFDILADSLAKRGITLPVSREDTFAYLQHLRSRAGKVAME